MKIQSDVVEAAASSLFSDPKLWERAKTLVVDMTKESELSSEDKHTLVHHDLSAVFSEIGSNVLNLAITLAVSWAKAQTA